MVGLDTADVILATALVMLLATVAALETVPYLWQRVKEYRAQPAIARRMREYVRGERPSS